MQYLCWGIRFFSVSSLHISSHHVFLKHRSNCEFEIKQVNRSDKCLINQLAAEPNEVYDKETYDTLPNEFIVVDHQLIIKSKKKEWVMITNDTEEK